MNLTEAYELHIEWKKRFHNAITNREHIDADVIASDSCCDLGKWLFGEAKDKFGGKNAYSECIQKHAAFHVEAGVIAKLINEGRYTEAENLLDADAYSLTSQAVGYAIFKLGEEIDD